MHDKSKNFDVITISQSWPQTTCWALNNKWTNDSSACCPCIMPESNLSWTLHGLWPSNSKGKHPSFCDSKIKFNKKLLGNGLITRMEDMWRTFKLNEIKEHFWKHEWDKHGTCAFILPRINGLSKYFTESVKLFDQFDIGKILTKAEIVPGRSYNYEDVVLIVQKILGVKIDVKCATHSVSRFTLDFILTYVTLNS